MTPVFSEKPPPIGPLLYRGAHLSESDSLSWESEISIQIEQVTSLRVSGHELIQTCKLWEQSTPCNN